ncbi:MAG TPA: MBL fold metallo-hydrolase [Solirubrobacterales bacterium]|nr:MBL fold metallo-hydrolase [Solirubrobacterales bacterium]
MKRLAPGVWRLKELPLPTINVYLAEDVLFDAGRRWDRRRIFAELQGVEISMVALTHAHPDHQGVAKDVCEARGVPLACHADDVEAMEGKRTMQEAASNHPVNRLIRTIWQGPPCKVDRVLNEGDEVGGFRVVHAPGHARGEVIFFRDSDRIAICGDVIRNLSYATYLPGIKEPPEIFTYDPAENRRSIRKLAALEPSLILPGHGGEVTDMDAFQRFAAALPD